MTRGDNEKAGQRNLSMKVLCKRNDKLGHLTLKGQRRRK